MPERPVENDPQQIAAILDQLKTSSPLGKQLEYARIWEDWAAIAGPEFAERSQPVTVRNGVLTIAADSSVLIHRMSFSRIELINKINKYLSNERIVDLFLTLASEDQLEDPKNNPA